MRLPGVVLLGVLAAACERTTGLRADASIETPDPRISLSFDEESKLLYRAVAPPPDDAAVVRVRDELEELIPGEGPLVSRYRAYQSRFLVPPKKLDGVLRRALEESRRRTRKHLDLPPGEAVDIEYVTGSPWPSFSTYLGNHRSLVQVNRDSPLPLSSVLEMAAHEAYPGHHTISVLLDGAPLDGPNALLDEALASYGIELAFPGSARLELERDVLFGLAGLDPGEAALYFDIERRVRLLAPLRVEAARQYLDGKLDRVQSAIFLEERALVLSSWEFLRFVDRYRTYVIAYTVGPDLVRSGGGSWQAFERLLLDLQDES